MADLVVKKASKEFAKSLNKRCPDSTIDALDNVVKEILKKAAKRANENNRKTITSYDL
jgi:histone H3/H4